jgi:hypothetical protein
MDKREVREILAAHADQLLAPDAPPNIGFGRNDQVQALLDLAEQLQGILIPVNPDTDFRRRLHGELLLEAQRREVDSQPGVFQQHRKGILIGAAAVGSVASVVGVAVAYVLRHRAGRATRIASG